MNKKTSKEFSEKVRVNYLSKDFNSLKNNLLSLIESYYPQTYRDFKDGSTGMMFVDLASYVGDVLSFYTDYQFNESFPGTATERKNIINMARFLGYKPKASRPSTVVLDVFQIIPSTIDDNGDFVPDYTFALKIKENMIVSTPDSVKFRTIQPIDFSVNTGDDPIEISVFNRNDAGEVETFLLKKQVNASAGEIVKETFQITSTRPFYKIELSRDNVIEILNVTDSDGYRWYEVDNLAQDIVLTNYRNISTNDSVLSKYQSSVPFMLGSLRTDRKFVTTIDQNNKTFLEFGSGENTSIQDEIVSNIKQVSLNRGINSIPIDPTNFVDGPSFGISPSSNTSITVEYVVGGGIQSNVSSNEIINVSRVEYDQDITTLTPVESELFRKLRNSLRVTNSVGATGGKGPETNNEIKQNSIAFFNAQNRIVTAEDYAVRVLSMPKKYGSVAKALSVSDDFLRENSNDSNRTDKNFAVNLYVLSYNSQKKLQKANDAIITNIKEFLKPYRMMTDDIIIRHGNIVNIGVNYEIIPFQGENKQLLLFNCNEAIKDFFDIDRWTFSEPINLNSLMLSIGNIEGVQSVSKIEIINKTIEDGNYSNIKYDIQGATRNGLILPSLDPSIFELKFPEQDISGKCL